MVRGRRGDAPWVLTMGPGRRGGAGRGASWVEIMGRGDALSARDRYEKAIERYREALALGGSRADLHARIGQSLHRMGLTEEAIEHLDAAIWSDPRHATALHAKAEALLALNRIDEARGFCGRAIEADPGDAGPHHTMGIIQFRLGDQEASIAEYVESVRIMPDNFRGHANMGVGHLEEGRLEEGLRCLDEALRINPKYAFAHYQRSVVLDRMGRKDEARKSHEKAVEHDPRYMLGDAGVHLRADRQAELSRAGWRDGRPPKGLGKVRVPTGRRRARTEKGRERDLVLGRLAAACELEGISLTDAITSLLEGGDPLGRRRGVTIRRVDAGPSGGGAEEPGSGRAKGGRAKGGRAKGGRAT